MVTDKEKGNLMNINNKMTKLFIILGAFTYSAMSSAGTILVEQWMNAGNNGFAGVEAAIAARDADYSGTFEIIDFTDDPAGFAGLIPGSSPWPAAVATGQSGTSAPVNQNFGARISTTLTITEADSYGFRTFADDGVWLRVDGVTVIYDNTYHPEAIRTGSIDLGVGTYAIELLFFEGGGEASLEFSMNKGGSAYDHVGNFAGTATTVPGPSTGLLASLGLLMLGLSRRRQKKA